MSRKLLAVLPVLGALSFFMLSASGPALGDTNGCPAGGTGNPQTSNLVGAHVAVNGNDLTYYFDSFTDESPSGGVPGLIEYCVYPDSAPASVNAVATGDDGSAWTDPTTFNNFSFQRPDGNPSNIGLDGTSHELGTASYDPSVPSGSDTILLHINDHSECTSLYGVEEDTCFVLPGTPTTNTAQGPTISKGASGSYDDTYHWTINKDACLDGTGGNTGKTCVTTVKQIGGTAKFNYSVTVTHGASQDSNVKVSGTITVTNPNSDAVAITGVTDHLSDNTACTITDTVPTSLPAGNTTLNYSCSLSAVPSTALTNTATVSWDAQTLTEGQLAAGSKSFTYPSSGGISFTATEKDTCVTVVDDNATPSDTSDDVTLGTHCISDGGETANGDGTFSYSFTFSRTYNVPANGCTSYKNTAEFSTNDTKTTGSDDATAAVCGPVASGALTMGFWKGPNGNALIQNYCAPSGKTSLATFLSALGTGSGPFKDAAGKTCSQLVTYVNGILNAASATDMNKMLRAQMLATALDYYLSTTTLGWSTSASGKVKPPSSFLKQGGLNFTMDMKAICPMVDNLSAGSATCTAGKPSTDGYAAGAFPSAGMLVIDLLNYEASNPPYAYGNPGVWYSGDRTKEEIAKNAFDQINNQDAFSV